MLLTSLFPRYQGRIVSSAFGLIFNSGDTGPEQQLSTCSERKLSIEIGAIGMMLSARVINADNDQFSGIIVLSLLLH